MNYWRWRKLAWTAKPSSYSEQQNGPFKTILYKYFVALLIFHTVHDQNTNGYRLFGIFFICLLLVCTRSIVLHVRRYAYTFSSHSFASRMYGCRTVHSVIIQQPRSWIYVIIKNLFLVCALRTDFGVRKKRIIVLSDLFNGTVAHRADSQSQPF